MPSSYPFWLGGVAASMAACCTHPLDVAKIRMQTLRTLKDGTQPSTLSVIRSTVAESGFLSIYTGLTASLMRQMTYSLVRLGAYEKLKLELSSGGHISTGNLLIAASVAGGLGGIAGNPADILLVRMTSDFVKPPEKRYGYSNSISGLVRLIREEGLKGLTRGLGANTARAMLMNASQIGTYDYFKSYFLRKPIPLIDYQLKDNFLLHVASSSIAGTVATTICSPADVIKSRMMASSGNQTMLQVMAYSFKHEGPMFIFKGWTPAFIRLAPNTVLLFVFFEQLKKGWSTL